MSRLLVVFILTCCYSHATSDSIVPIKKQEMGVTNRSNVKCFLRGSKTIVNKVEEVEERGSPVASITELETLLKKVVSPERFNTIMAKKKVKLENAKVEKEYTKLEAWKIIAKGQVKPVVIIAAISLLGGYLAYLVKG
ncbi:hypothetical protein KXD40_000559 [Peronospora effusa]|uniref:RxLR effector protein n=1 Tax=Peronospora effusa TaxID=542832 RepID=A0A3M6VC32_9STRA|nr:hypothetical protein DD238_006402 [Peronospora effusa]UIZ21085.1 hypothetical protein KXD40_000559 [Peronospora effusa]CAI5723116.1 unnamed protein product [Peronospora effusa]